MAYYNNGFPVTYQPMYFQQPMQAPVMPTQPMQQQTPQQPAQVMQGGFVRVMSENEARMYPVAPGNSVTFINENAPYCYTKTVNIGQLDRPTFEKYRLVKEDDAQISQNAQKTQEEKQVPDLSDYVTKGELAAVAATLDSIRNDIETFRGDLYGIAGKKNTNKKKEAATDE